jgi:hypothetical protein
MTRLHVYTRGCTGAPLCSRFSILLFSVFELAVSLLLQQKVSYGSEGLYSASPTKQPPTNLPISCLCSASPLSHHSVTHLCLCSFVTFPPFFLCVCHPPRPPSVARSSLPCACVIFLLVCLPFPSLLFSARCSFFVSTCVSSLSLSLPHIVHVSMRMSFGMPRECHQK